ncbi:Tigger transposable element-derived protein 4, partial [Orchesella cincta]
NSSFFVRLISNKMSEKVKRKSFSLADKLKIIQKFEDKEGIKSQNVQFNADFKKSSEVPVSETARSRHIPVNGPLLQEKAKEFASLDGIPNFEASNGC